MMKTTDYILDHPSIEKIQSKYHKHKTIRYSQHNIINHLKIADQELLHISNKNGLLVSISLILFFLLMKYFGLHYQLLLRYLNFIFLFGGVFSSLRFYKMKYYNKINYHTGLRIGLRVSLLATIPFVIFMFFFLAVNPSFLNFINLQIDVEKSNFINPAIASIYLLAEGVFFGAISTIISIKFLKK